MTFLSKLSRHTAIAAALSALALGAAHAQNTPWHNMGRDATPAEVKAWDIDVRPDFKGLPKGAGSVSLGETVWEAKCASCHGSFGESNEVFTPIIGGTTKKDIETGRVAALVEGAPATAPPRPVKRSSPAMQSALLLEPAAATMPATSSVAPWPKITPEGLTK